MRALLIAVAALCFVAVGAVAEGNRDCSGKRSVEDVVQWFAGAKIVETPYNRIASK